MIEERETICICCPIGCNLKIQVKENEITVKGNSCPRGAKYGEDEVKSPKRMVTSVVRVEDGIIDMVSVKTKDSIPKSLIFRVLEEIKKIKLVAPINIGDIVLQNVCDTGVDIIATKKVEKK